MTRVQRLTQMSNNNPFTLKPIPRQISLKMITPKWLKEAILKKMMRNSNLELKWQAVLELARPH